MCLNFTTIATHAAAAVALLAASAGAHAQGAPSSPQFVGSAPRADVPPCVCTASTSADADGLATPGPYAKYLIHIGMSKAQALEAARSIDERQLRVNVSRK